MFGSDKTEAKLADQEDLEEKLESAEEIEDADLDSEEARVNLAKFINDQISQALLTGRIESETRAGEGKDPLLMAVAVCAITGIVNTLILAYQFYL